MANELNQSKEIITSFFPTNLFMILEIIFIFIISEISGKDFMNHHFYQKFPVNGKVQ